MTRYTKLERKRHVDASESFTVTPLMPSKVVKSTDNPTQQPQQQQQQQQQQKPQVSNEKPSGSSSSSSSSSSEKAKETKAEGNKTNSKKRKAETEPETKAETKTETKAETAALEVEPSNENEKKKKQKKNSKNKKGKDNTGKDAKSESNMDNSTRSERRRLRRQKEKANASICFACRKTGHSAKNCKETTGEVGMCYSCGSLEHTTKDCRKLSKDGNKFKFATCFVCKEQGHLAGKCPKNEKGLYPNGGSCRFCGKVDHLAKDCKLTKEEVGTLTVGKIDLVQGADDDDFHIFVDEKRKLTEEQKAIKKIIKTNSQSNAKAVKKVVSF